MTTTAEPKTPALSHFTRYWLMYTLPAIVLVFSAFGLLLWKVGLFGYTGTEPSAKAIAASLALAGALVGSLVSIVGILLKHSIDLRTAALNEQNQQRLEIETRRANDLEREAEHRLKLEAAIEAAKLLGTSTTVGALFTLSSLGIHDLATVLTGHLLSTSQIDANSAAWMLHRSLKCGDEELQVEAITLVSAYAKKFQMDDGKATFPDCLMDWDLSLRPHVRYHGAIALGNLLISRPHRDWDPFMPPAFVATFALAWQTEPDKFVRTEIGSCLKAILPAVPHSSVLFHQKGEIDIAKTKEEIKELSAELAMTQDLILKINDWAAANRKDEPGSANEQKPVEQKV